MPRRYLLWIRDLVPIVVLAVGAGPAVAQVRLELEPAIGVYAGFGSFRQPATRDPFSFPQTLSQRPSVALGAQLTAWLGTRVGVRMLLFSAASRVGPEERDPLNREPVPSRITAAGLEALVPLRAVTSRGRVFVSGGATLLHRGGEAYEGFQGTTDLGGTVGLGSQFRLTERLSLQGDVRALLYQVALTDPSAREYPSAFQTDLLVHIGLVLGLSPWVRD